MLRKYLFRARLARHGSISTTQTVIDRTLITYVENAGAGTMEHKHSLARTTSMPLPTYVCLALMSLGSVGIAQVAKQSENNDPIQIEIRLHQYDISKDGRSFLLGEAQKASFFLLGELHGENEIPALLRDLWPAMWQGDYRYIAAELSPWAANQLEFVPADRQPKILHRIPQEKRSPLQQRLVYWADSYDAIICYKNVTPLAQ